MYNIYIFMYIDVSYYIVDIILSYYPTTWSSYLHMFNMNAKKQMNKSYIQ